MAAMKRALIGIVVLLDAGILVYLGGGVLPAAVFVVFVAAFILPACVLLMRLSTLRAMPADLRLTAAAVLVVIMAVPWFFARKALPFPPVILDVVLCLILSAAAAKFGRLAATINELRPVLIRSRFVVMAVLPVLFALVWLGYAVPANGQVLFHGLFAVDFGNLVSVVATLRASPFLPLAAIADGGWVNYHWLYFALPASLVDFCGVQIPAFNALILMNLLMAVLLVHTLMTLIATHYPRSERTAQWTVAVVLFAPFTGYYYQIAASRLSLGWFAMPVRNHLVLSPLNSMIVFGNNTFALVLALFTAMMLERWNSERRLGGIVLGTFALSMVAGYSVTLLLPLVAALILWLLIGRIERPVVAFTAALLIGGIVTAMFVAIHVLGGGGARHAAFAFDGGQFLRIAILGMLPLWWLAWMAGRTRLTFFHVLIAAAIAVPSVLYVAGSPTGQVDVSMKTGSLLAIAFAPLVGLAIDKWLSGETGRAQSAVAALLIALGVVQTAVYVLQFPYYRITNSSARSVPVPLDYYNALVWIRDHTPPRSIVVDPGGLTLRDENPTLWIAERRGWLPTLNSETFLSPLHSDIAHRASVWADFMRDPARSTSAGLIASQADYLMIPRPIQSPFWIPVSRTGSWWIYQSVRTRSAQNFSRLESLPVNVRLRHTIGALVYDWIPFELHLRGIGPNKGLPEAWLLIRNRREEISTNGRGVQCHWRFSSDLHICKVFPSTAARLMRRSLARSPITMCDAPAPMSGPPRLTFVIGHRGTERLPHLLATLRNIAAQTGVAFECIVVEQSVAPEVERHLPSWIRYIHTPLPRPDLPYCRSWAFNVAARQARGDILVLQDNDVLIPQRYAFEAVQRIEEGYSFVDLKRYIYYLDASATASVFVTGAPPKSAPVLIVQNLDGGSIVARRDAYEAIGGFDESYVGWGGEDNDFVDRARVFGGIYRFGYLPMLHLQHPPQPGKLSPTTGAIRRYRLMETVAPEQRIARLRATEQGLMSGPSIPDDVRRGE